MPCDLVSGALSVLQATSEDALTLSLLLFDAFQVDFSAVYGRSLASVLRSEHEFVALGLLDGEPAGCLMANLGDIHVLHTLCVAPSFRRRSVATSLIRRMVGMLGARDPGRPICILVARSGLPLTRLLGELGFERLPDLDPIGTNFVPMVRR